MSKIHFEIATQKDDLQLCEIMKKNYIEGAICVAFEAEPSFFQAAKTQGKKVDVVVGKDEDGVIQIVGIRAIKPMYLSGKVVNVGYLSGLRVNTKIRNNIWLTKIYGFLKEADENVPFYLTTIISDNKKAIKVLESNRKILPKYKKIGNFLTFLIPKQKVKSSKNFEIHTGNVFSIDEILDFINREGKKKQFFPFYKKEDFGTDFLKGLNIKDFYVATQKGQIKGLIGLWDQQKFKQTKVINYSKTINLLKPIYNLLSPILRIPRLVNIGERFNNVYAAMPVCENNDPVILQSLLSYLMPKIKHENLLLGFSENDSLIKSVSKFGKRKYFSNIYVVSFDDIDVSEFAGKIPYLELGAL